MHIVTTYLGPTNYLPARYSATVYLDDGSRVRRVIGSGYLEDHDSDAPGSMEPHRRIAERIMAEICASPSWQYHPAYVWNRCDHPSDPRSFIWAPIMPEHIVFETPAGPN